MFSVFHGAHLRLSVEPHIVTIGLPRAAAICIAPPSQQITSLHMLIAAMSSFKFTVLYRADFINIRFAIASAFSSSPGWNGFLLLPGAQRIMGIMLYLFISSLPSSINLFVGQRLFSFLLLMCIAMRLGCGMWDVGCGNKNFKTFSFSSADGSKTSLEGSPSIPNGSRSLKVAITSCSGSV